MKKWLVYVLGIVTGFVLSIIPAITISFFINKSNDLGIEGLQMFDEPGENMDYSTFKIINVLESGCALAIADDNIETVALIFPNKGQHFYNNQKIDLLDNQCAQRVGTFKYTTNWGFENSVPAVKIISDGKSSNSNKIIAVEDNTGRTLFEEPRECVSRRNFQVKKVLDSGDAIAEEIVHEFHGNIFTSDLEVLILAQEGSDFYNNQVVKAPQGTCARQIGNYKYQTYGSTKVIPIIAFK